jgi:hypothetical protein
MSGSEHAADTASYITVNLLGLEIEVAPDEFKSFEDIKAFTQKIVANEAYSDFWDDRYLGLHEALIMDIHDLAQNRDIPIERDVGFALLNSEAQIEYGELNMACCIAEAVDLDGGAKAAEQARREFLLFWISQLSADGV